MKIFSGDCIDLRYWTFKFLSSFYCLRQNQMFSKYFKDLKTWELVSEKIWLLCLWKWLLNSASDVVEFPQKHQKKFKVQLFQRSDHMFVQFYWSWILSTVDIPRILLYRRLEESLPAIHETNSRIYLIKIDNCFTYATPCLLTTPFVQKVLRSVPNQARAQYHPVSTRCR